MCIAVVATWATVATQLEARNGRHKRSTGLHPGLGEEAARR